VLNPTNNFNINDLNYITSILLNKNKKLFEEFKIILLIIISYNKNYYRPFLFIINS
jgi:hypothetical protein